MTTLRSRFPTLFVLIAAVALALPLLATADHVQAQSENILTLDFDGLTSLGEGYAYEGWLIVDGEPVSTGVFTVDGDGNPSQTEFTVPVAPGEASAFVLTIEPSPDPDPAPSKVHLIGGDLSGGTAPLTVGHESALGNDFSGASGSYVLAVPSDENAPYSNGIWWLDPSAGPGPALDLPDLPEGWVYEGWVVGDDGPVSTGRFSAVSGADSDGAGPAAGPNDGPAFPGQDFVNPASNLIGQMAVITIEPQPDDSPDPFVLKPLVDAEIEDVGAETSQEMMLDTASFPTGSATLVADAMMEDDEMMDDEMADDESMDESGPAPELMPETGGDAPSNASLALLAILAGLLLLGGGRAIQRRTRHSHR